MIDHALAYFVQCISFLARASLNWGLVSSKCLGFMPGNLNWSQAYLLMCSGGLVATQFCSSQLGWGLVVLRSKKSGFRWCIAAYLWNAEHAPSRVVLGVCIMIGSSDLLIVKLKMCAQCNLTQLG